MHVVRETWCFQYVWESPKSCTEWKTVDHYGAIRVGRETNALTARKAKS